MLVSTIDEWKVRILLAGGSVRFTLSSNSLYTLVGVQLEWHELHRGYIWVEKLITMSSGTSGGDQTYFSHEVRPTSPASSTTEANVLIIFTFRSIFVVLLFQSQRYRNNLM